MSSCPSPCDDIRARALELGATAAGCSPALAVSDEVRSMYSRWVEDGRCGDMAFCRRYDDLRSDPRRLLPGARTVISCAFPYPAPKPSDASETVGSHIAAYAQGPDYHVVVRSALADLAGYITGRWGGECRVCVDTAPLRERYWAVRCGLGHIGLNGQLIVPGAGSYVFLGEILWTGEVGDHDHDYDYDHDHDYDHDYDYDHDHDYDHDIEDKCRQCGACVRACPNGALDGHGGCDARRCVSYLTIEHRGEIPADMSLAGYIYGCDICQRVCPENIGIDLPNLFSTPMPLMSLTPDQVETLSAGAYRRLTALSAMNRITLRQLLRNIAAEGKSGS